MRAARFQTQKLETAWSSLVTMHSEDIDCSSSASAVGASDEEQGNESNSSSVPLHSGDEQETSPSQYRKAMFRKSEAEREDWEAEGGEEPLQKYTPGTYSLKRHNAENFKQIYSQ